MANEITDENYGDGYKTHRIDYIIRKIKNGKLDDAIALLEWEAGIL